MSHSSSNKTRKWTIKKKFEGSPKRDDFEIVEEELPPLKDGEVLVEAQWITVDPYMRLSELGEKIGDCVLGGQVAK
jgi:prostaglandin reductase 1